MLRRGSELDQLEWVASCLRSRGPDGKGDRLPGLWFVTDPDRTPDPAAVARRLPPGACVIFRGFGRADAEDKAMALQAACRAGGLVLLIGQDEGLALKAGADGVHLPERRLSTAAGLRRRHPDWLVTSAAHSASAIRKARSVGLDAVLVSAVFASRSPSAGRPLGVMRLAALAGSAGLPVIALGGVSARTAPQLIGTPVSGIAAVDGFRT